MKLLIVFFCILFSSCKGQLQQPTHPNDTSSDALAKDADASHKPDGLDKTDVNSPHTDVNSPHTDVNSPHTDVGPDIADMTSIIDLDTGKEKDLNTQTPTFAERINDELAIDLEAQKTRATQDFSAGQNPTIRVTQNGQKIDNLIIYAGTSDECGIEINGYDNVTIDNVTIYHANRGICSNNSKDLHIKNVRLISLAAPNTGPHCVRPNGNNDLKTGECWNTRNASADFRLGIYLKNATNTTIQNVYTVQASSGVYAISSPETRISEIRCFDMRGPFPRGQCVQFNRSNNSSVTTFYAKNYFDQSHSEDNFNAYESDDIKFENGLIDGNFSINGVGIIADSGSDNVEVYDIDILHTSVSGVSVYANKEIGKNFKASKIRVKNTQCFSRKGGTPSSGGLIIAAQPGAENFSFDDIIWKNHCRQGIAWCRPGSVCQGITQGGSMTNIREQDFTTRWTNE